MKKNAKYTFRINEEVKDKFKAYCRIMNISPSDILCEVVQTFNDDVEKIMEIRDIEQLQSLVRSKFSKVEHEISLLEEKKKQQ